MQRITDFRQLFLNDIPLLDVRAPVEFSGGAFPTSSNIPLLTDDERHQIGICYKQHGQQAAIALGQKLVSGAVRDARIAAWSRWVADHPEGVLYCFRGGLRSQTVQQWLAEAGVVIPLVSGGYKAMRRFLLEESERLIRDLPLVIVCGRTGTGKTRVIEALPNSIDLEGIAHHRGSAFGRRPGGQPSQIDFENRLAVALLKQSLPEYAQIVLEDESRLIGRCHLPLSLQERIKDGARILIDEDLDSRVNVTLEDYVLAPWPSISNILVTSLPSANWARNCSPLSTESSAGWAAYATASCVSCWFRLCNNRPTMVTAQATGVGSSHC